MIQQTQTTLKTHLTCTDDWDHYCKSLNKTCFVDEEEVLQCGGCLEEFQPVNGKCLRKYLIDCVVVLVEKLI